MSFRGREGAHVSETPPPGHSARLVLAARTRSGGLEAGNDTVIDTPRAPDEHSSRKSDAPPGRGSPGQTAGDGAAPSVRHYGRSGRAAVTITGSG